jgi:hypothetical protein
VTSEEIEARFAAVDEKIAAVDAALARLGRVDALPWETSGDGVWTAQLPDGRTARIERLDDGASFLPWVGEFTGPVCAGLLPAANWCTEHAA